MKDEVPGAEAVIELGQDAWQVTADLDATGRQLRGRFVGVMLGDAAPAPGPAEPKRTRHVWKAAENPGMETCSACGARRPAHDPG